jgi:hypothetical protein
MFDGQQHREGQQKKGLAQRFGTMHAVFPIGWAEQLRESLELEKAVGVACSKKCLAFTFGHLRPGS